MMNKNFTKLTTVLLFLTGVASTVSAQYLKVGNNTFSLNSSAVLQIDTYTVPLEGKARGFLPPRMTTVEREGIIKSDAGSISAAEGLVVYDTTKDALMVNTGIRYKADGTTIEGPDWKTTSAVGVTKYKKATSAYTMALDDYTILGDASAGPLTLTLTPVPSIGRVLVVGKSDLSTNNRVTFSPALKLPVGKNAAGKDITSDVTYLDFSKTYTIQSNGTDWYIIGGF